MATTSHNRRCISVGLALRSMLVVAVFGTLPAEAQTYAVLHRFVGLDGAFPYASLIADPAGNLFGTTYAGGAFGNGTVFKLNLIPVKRLA